MADLKDMGWLMERLGTTERHIRAMVYNKQIPTIRVGRLLRWDPDAIDQWLNEHSR